jgi:hypothetical protein
MTCGPVCGRQEAASAAKNQMPSPSLINDQVKDQPKKEY